MIESDNFAEIANIHEITKKELDSGDSVTLITYKYPEEGVDTTVFQVRISKQINGESQYSMKLPISIQSQTRARARQIFDDINPTDSFTSILERRQKYA